MQALPAQAHDVGIWFACFVSICLGFFTALADLRAEIKRTKATGYVMWLRSPSIWAFCITFAVICFAATLYIFRVPDSDLAKLTRAASRDSDLGAAALISLACIAIIKSKIVDTSSGGFGIEALYNWYRLWVIKNFKAHSAHVVRNFVAREVALLRTCQKGAQALARDVYDFIRDAALFENEPARRKFEKQVKDIDLSVLNDPEVLKYTLEICIRYTGVRSTKQWSRGHLKNP